MKCVKDNRTAEWEDVVRVSNEKAAKLVKTGNFQYIGKKYWKQTGRKYADFKC